ncbi:DUF4892 domain-containing protein [Teredinibacter haidensis]|uniref:DUF4892 domain-containing protein n=1 Tax=Teredinibacter haidensis TaxID=2731755 RepID=UPI000948DFDE|nr:DUF4892 domain-containing protein [Teredinibacter haidensis]
MIRKRLIVLLIVFIATSVAVAKAQLAELFAGARVIYTQTVSDDDYRLSLSAPKKINSQWVFERREKLQGKVSRQTLELESTYTFNDARRRLETFFKTKQARLLFSCSGLDCGSSNAWANEVFKVKQLYGLDTLQWYQVWETTEDGIPNYLIAYLSQRGNRRIYLQLESLEVSGDQVVLIEANPRSVLNSLLENAFYVVPGTSVAAEKNQHLVTVASALKLRPMQKVIVVGHIYQSRKTEENLQLSVQLAEQVYNRLIVLGVREAQLSFHGVGALAPQRRNGLSRVELVLP